MGGLTEEHPAGRTPGNTSKKGKHMDGFEYRFADGLENGGIAQAIRAAEGRLVAEVLEMEPVMGVVSVDVGSGIVADVYV